MVEVNITILADSAYESLESFTVELKPLDQSGLEIKSGRGVARVDIFDDDSEELLFMGFFLEFR